MSRSSTEPDFTPRPGDLTDVLRRAARRRQHRRARAVAGVVPLAAVALALGAGGRIAPGGRLTVAPPGSESPAASPKPSPAASESPDPLLPTPLPSRLPSLLPSPSDSPSPKPTPSAEPSGPPEPEPKPDQRAEFAWFPGTAPEGCVRTVIEDPDAPDADRGWCTRYAGPATVRSGERAELGFELCRDAGAGEGTLTAYEAGRWLKVQLATGADIVGAWSGRSEPDLGTIRAAAGGCLRWTVPWRIDDERYGEPLAPGTYELRQHFLVRQEVHVNGADRYTIVVED